jgi:hypothetical protein
VPLSLVATTKDNSTHSRVHSSLLKPKKLLILNINGVLCYFPFSVILEGNVRMFGRNVDKAKVEVKVGVEDFLTKAFEKYCIVIWSCMKLEDVVKVLPMLMLENFMDRFVFLRGCEQCSKMAGQISLESHYYLKDLKRVYYGCCGLPYGKQDQTLLIDNEPNKVMQNSKWSVLFLESFKGKMLLKNKVQWLDLASHLWPPLVGLPLAKMVQVHYDFMVKYFKLHLNSSSKNYYWFLQYMGSDNGDVCNVPPSLNIKYSESFYFIISFYSHL